MPTTSEQPNFDASALGGKPTSIASPPLPPFPLPYPHRSRNAFATGAGTNRSTAPCSAAISRTMLELT